MFKESSEKTAHKHLQTVLHNEIPLTKIMGISVTHCDQNKVELRAPLTPNINHKCTAFGGSLYSVAVLCGWSYIYHQMQLNKLSGHIVIQHSDVSYKKPVDGEIVAICELSDRSVLNRFIKTFNRKGKARLKLQIKIIFHNEDALLFNGQYVVHT